MSSILKPVLGSQLQFGHHLANGLVGCWLLNEGTGSKVFDLSGNGKSMTLYEDTKWSSGIYGSCLEFDGAGDYGKIVSPVNLGNSGTVIIRFLTHDADTIQQLWYHYNSNDRFYLNLSNVGAGAVAWGLALGNETVGWTYAANTWYTLALTWNNGNMSLILDGTTVLTTDTYTGTVDTDNADWFFGTHSDLSSYPFDGFIDYFMTYNRALSTSEIAHHYREPFCMFERDPIELWSAATLGAAPPVGMAGAMTTNTGYWGW